MMNRLQIQKAWERAEEAFESRNESKIVHID